MGSLCPGSRCSRTLYPYPEHPMLIAIGINKSMPLFPKTYRNILFRVQFSYLQRACRHIRNKGNIMFLAHLVIHCHEVLIIHGLNTNQMVLPTWFRFLLWQRNPTAGKTPLSHSGNDIAADRTDIKKYISKE